MAHKKGNCYDPRAAVESAIQKSGWKPTVFFAHAKTFTGTNGFDPAAAAKEYESANADPLPAVVTFADWINTREPKDIHARFH